MENRNHSASFWWKIMKGSVLGFFHSSGGFTSEAKREAMRSHVHVELIDLWEEFYSKLSDEDKQHLPPAHLLPLTRELTMNS